MTLPHLEKRENGTALIVNDKPFIGLAGEIHNSSASDSGYMEENVWPQVTALNINTLVAPVYWEMIEPEKSQFDFATVDYLITSARAHHVKLVLLWFGLWKNAGSTYVPEWVKLDPATIYSQDQYGRHLLAISPSDQRSIELDANAFSHLMAHIKQLDEAESTVIMVQVENETGLLNADFDHAIDEDQALAQPVPASLAPETQQSWRDYFGETAKEHYMAYLFASAVETVAAAGKKEYPLPMYVNAWQQKPLDVAGAPFPGTYPTGGPTVKMVKTWRKVAPSIDLCAPDIYVPNFTEVTDAYFDQQDALLVPEAARDLTTVSNLIYAIGNYDLLLFSPFGAEDFFKAPEKTDPQLLKALAIDPSAFEQSGTGPAIATAYRLLKGLIPLLAGNQESKRLHAFIATAPADEGARIRLGNCNVVVHYSPLSTEQSPAAGFVLELAANEFLVFGINIQIQLEPSTQTAEPVGILKLEEGEMVDGKWQGKRILNGDEQYIIKIGQMPGLLKFKTFNY